LDGTTQNNTHQECWLLENTCHEKSPRDFGLLQLLEPVEIKITGGINGLRKAGRKVEHLARNTINGD
jgi:hypothetical protein